MQNNDVSNSSRRSFLGSLATGAATFGAASLASLSAAAKSLDSTEIAGADEWFKQIKGKHRVVFDATEPNDLMPFAWPKVFLMTNEATGTPEKENSVVVVFRHNAIGYALNDQIWSKYKLGDLFKAPDPRTGKNALRNPFWKTKPDDFVIPGIGAAPISIGELQASGVLFCVCSVAITVYSAAVAQQMGLDAAEVKKEWESALIPGIQIMPSGVWAVGRAQERGCAYVFAG